MVAAGKIIGQKGVLPRLFTHKYVVHPWQRIEWILLIK